MSKPTARAVVFLVLLQVFGELVNPLGEERNLDVGGTRVLVVDAHTFYDFRFFHIGTASFFVIERANLGVLPWGCKALFPARRLAPAKIPCFVQ